MAERLWSFQRDHQSLGRAIFNKTLMVSEKVLVFRPVNVFSREYIVTETDDVIQRYAKSGCSDEDIVGQIVNGNGRRSDDH
jgi:hypothetical protein